MVMPLLALVAMTCPPALGGESKVTKLQIGVKKRIPADECTIKSRKGDKLSMHYTVKHTLFRQLLSEGLETLVLYFQYTAHLYERRTNRMKLPSK